MVQDIHRWDQMPPHGNEWPLARLGTAESARRRRWKWNHIRLRGQTTADGDAFPGFELPFFSRRSARLDELEPVPPGAAARTGAAYGRGDSAEAQSRRYPGWGDRLFRGREPYRANWVSTTLPLTIPDSAPIRFDKARLLFDRGRLHLAPAVVRTAQDDQAELEADYAFETRNLALAISTPLLWMWASLRSQVALAAVPWLEQVRSGRWTGQLRYSWRPRPVEAGEDIGWTGRFTLTDARIPLAGFAEPLQLSTANVQITARAMILDRMRAQRPILKRKANTGTSRLRCGPTGCGWRSRNSMRGAERVLMPALSRGGGLIAGALSLGACLCRNGWRGGISMARCRSAR